MEIFRRLFGKKEQRPAEENKVEQIKETKEKIQLNFSEIKEEPGQVYFTVSGEAGKIQINEIQKIYDEIIRNLDIPPQIRQSFGVETSAEGVLKVVFHIENYQLEGFVDEAKRLLNEMKSKLESKFQ